MKKVFFTVLTVLTTLLLVPNVTKAASASVSLTPNKSIDNGDEVILEVNYGSEVSSMYFDVGAVGFCTLFDCKALEENPRENITIDGKAIGTEKTVRVGRAANRNLQIGIEAMNGDDTTFTTVQVKTKALSNVTRTTIKVSNLRSVSLPQAPGKTVSVDIIDEYNFVLKNNGEDVTLPIPRGTTLKSLIENPYMQSVEAIKKINGVMNNEKFAKFINVETGEEFKVSDSIDANITVKAAYYISLTIDGKKYDKILENAKLADLYEYATEKDGYEFVGFTNDDGTMATDEDVVEGAKFISSYKKIEEKTSANNVVNPETSDNINLYFTIGIISIVVIGLISKSLLNTVKKN